ncbi:MAG: cyclic nucleotide-binding domain-containing protein [Myxococcales bacterium]|nr:cyclic nucleotide-binding domain-containing protein [Myxococcales bacterium]
MPGEASLRVEHELFVRSFFTDRPPPRLVSQLAARMRDAHYTRGQAIYARGGRAGTVYFIVDGEVHLEASGTDPWVFDAGAMIGINDAVLDQPHARTARAMRATHVVTVEYEDYIDILEDNFEYAKGTLERGMGRIHQLSRELGPAGVFSPRDLGAPDPLPLTPGQALSELERILVLRQVPALSDAPVQPLVTLAAGAEVHHFAPDQAIVAAGAPPERVWVVAAGRVRVSDPSVQIHAHFEPGSILGAQVALSAAPWLYATEASTQATLLSFSREDLFDVMEDHFRLGRCLFRWMARENGRARDALADRTHNSSDGVRVA